MISRRVLLVDTRGTVSPDFPTVLDRESDGSIAAELTTEVYEALHRISERGFDAVICWAEHKDDLIGVIQIRKARASLPIVVLSTQDNPAFAALAIQMGATRVSKLETELLLVTQTIQLILQSADLASEVQSRAAEHSIRVQELQLLAQENRNLVRAARAQVARKGGAKFVPLVVEDNPNHALLLVHAFRKANVFAPLPIMKSAEEAIAYLSDLGESGSAMLPRPSIILVDLELPRKSGLEVLEWIRNNPSLADVQVVVLSSSTNPDHVNRAYQLGAHSYLLKPTTLDALVRLVTTLADLHR